MSPDAKVHVCIRESAYLSFFHILLAFSVFKFSINIFHLYIFAHIHYCLFDISLLLVFSFIHSYIFHMLFFILSVDR